MQIPIYGKSLEIDLLFKNIKTGIPADAPVLGDVQYSLQVHKVLWPYAKTEK